MANRRDWEMSKKQQNIYQNLWNQAQKILDFRTHHQGKRGTARYREGVRAFCKHLAINYQSKNFKNISDKHLKSFVDESKKMGVSDRTLKTDLSGIRKLHSMQPKTKYHLNALNKELGVGKVTTRGVDRAWTNNELKNAIAIAKTMGREDVANALAIARTTGTRIEEVTYLSRSDLRNALVNNYLSLINTKGGIPRDVPLTKQSKRVFQDILSKSSVNDKLFIGHGRTHQQARESITDWIYNHRTKFQENILADSKYKQQLKIDYERKDLTFHGVRHAYAREQYYDKIIQGMSEKEARQEVAVQLGHGRDDVTRIYLNQ